MDRIDGVGQILGGAAKKRDIGLGDEIGDAIARIGSEETKTLPNATVGQGKVIGINPNAPNGGVLNYDKHGYGVDLNGDGKYTAGQDAVVGLDLNGDGKLSESEVNRSNQILSNWGGDADYNDDGKVSKQEQADYTRGKQLDRDGDGVLSQSELKKGGAKAWVDRDGDGIIGKGETHEVDKIGRGLRGSSQIADITPGEDKARVKNKSLFDDIKKDKFPSKLEPKIERKLEPKVENKLERKLDHKVEPK